MKKEISYPCHGDTELKYQEDKFNRLFSSLWVNRHLPLVSFEGENYCPKDFLKKMISFRRRVSPLYRILGSWVRE